MFGTANCRATNNAHKFKPDFALRLKEVVQRGLQQQIQKKAPEIGAFACGQSEDYFRVAT